MNEMKAKPFSDGKGYNNARKEYPNQLIDDIVSTSRISQEAELLDVGCGPGKSTLPFVKRGYNVLALDPSESMIREAKEVSRDFPNVTYLHTPMESADLAGRKFDLILFGQSLQRFDQDTVYARTSSLLKDGGHMAAFWGLYGWNKVPLLRRVVKIFKSYSLQFPRDWEIIRRETKDRMGEAPEFYQPRVKYYDLVEEFSKKEFVRLAGSFSWTSALNDSEKGTMLKQVESSLREEQEPFKVPITYTLAMMSIKR